MEFFTKFPVMERSALAEFRKSIDFAFRDFSRAYGDGIESFFDPLLYFLVWLEKLMMNSPWPIIIGIICGLAWMASKSWKLVLGAAISFFLIGYFGMWKDCMATVAIITVCVIICMTIGIPMGVIMARSNRAERTILPVLDMMQTIPSFVYLIPILMLLGIGKVPGLIATTVLLEPPPSRRIESKVASVPSSRTTSESCGAEITKSIIGTSEAAPKLFDLTVYVFVTIPPVKDDGIAFCDCGFTSLTSTA